MSDIQTATPYRDQARAHFKAMFGDQRGWLELSAIEGDPDDRTRCRFRQGWFDYAPERIDTLLDQVRDLLQRYGNVYTSITLYDARVRDKAHALDGRVIFVDDAPPASYTYTLQTSRDREQGFIILDTSADVATREQIARRFAHAGADTSGWDITQLARVPGTFNTKARTGGRYTSPHAWVSGSGQRVTLIPRTLQLYTLHDLKARTPATSADPGTFDAAAIDLPKVSFWLGNLDSLLGADGLPRRLSLKSRTRQILADGLQWSDTSAQRYAVARGLVMHGYPDDEIAALLIHFCDYGRSTLKSSDWLYADIARVIAKERLAQPQVTTSSTVVRTAQPATRLPHTSRARKDRPTRFDPAMLFARYQAEPDLCALKRKARAAQLGISTATLDRLEDSLETLTLIKIDAKPGMPGQVTILVGVINIPAPEVLSGVLDTTPAEPQNMRSECAENADRTPQCIGGTHPPPVAPAVPAAPRIGYDADGHQLGLAELVRDGLDQGGRPTFKRIREYVQRNAASPQAFSEGGIRRVYDRELKQRRYAKQDAKLEAAARTMRQNVLQRKSRAAASRLEEYNRTGDKRAGVWRTIAGIYAAEEARRSPAIELTTHELWAEVDQDAYQEARQQLRKPTARLASQQRRGACVPPNPAPAGAAGMYERLQQLKAQRESAVQ